MKLSLLSVFTFLFVFTTTAQISVSPTSGCAGSSFNITITNGSSMNASSAACNVTGGVTAAGGGPVTLSGSSFSAVGNLGTTTTGTLSIPSNFTPGVYGFSITVCNNTYSCTNCFTVLGKPTNVSLSPGGVSQICSGATNNITCNATGATSYQWKLNNNNINLANASTYNANAAGTYTCEAINSCGATISSNSLVVSVVSAPSAVTVSASGNTTICSGGSVSLTCTATGATSYQWKLNNNNINLATSSTYSANASGTYTCEAINSCGNTVSSNSVSVTVNNAPTNVSVSPNGMQGFCTGNSLLLTCSASGASSYQWMLNGNDIQNQTSTTFTATVSGTYTCKAINTCGEVTSSNSAEITVETNPLSATVSPAGAISICQGTGQILTCNATGAVSYQWKKDGTDIPAAISATYNASSDGVYTCEAYGLYCMAASSNSTTITTTTTPTPPSLGSSLGSSFCLGDTTVISAPLGFSAYTWSTGATTSSIDVVASGTYVVTVNSNCGLVTSNPITVTANDPGIPTITQAGETLTAVSASAVSYKWFFNGNEINGATSSTYTATQSGSYSVQIEDANGCSAVSSNVNVTVIGIEQLNSNAAVMTLIPNPAQSKVTVSTSFNTPYTISLINIYGQVVLMAAAESSTNVVDVESLSAGIYILKSENAEGVVTKQFIKE
jgi:hypothetical protein